MTICCYSLTATSILFVCSVITMIILIIAAVDHADDVHEAKYKRVYCNILDKNQISTNRFEIYVSINLNFSGDINPLCDNINFSNHRLEVKNLNPVPKKGRDRRCLIETSERKKVCNIVFTRKLRDYREGNDLTGLYIGLGIAASAIGWVAFIGIFIAILHVMRWSDCRYACCDRTPDDIDYPLRVVEVVPSAPEQVNIVIDPLVLQRLDSIQLCTICQCGISDNGGITKCGHKFHKACINQWIEEGGNNRNRCPNCAGGL